jgi:hypothetical protein
LDNGSLVRPALVPVCSVKQMHKFMQDCRLLIQVGHFDWKIVVLLAQNTHEGPFRSHIPVDIADGPASERTIIDYLDVDIPVNQLQFPLPGL